jgi:integrase
MQRWGLSAATITQTRGVLSSALRQAVEDGLIAVNPVVAVRRPRIRPRELHWPTPVELSALLEIARGTLWEIPMLMSVATGARRSEVLGLSWEDVDFSGHDLYPARRPTGASLGERDRSRVHTAQDKTGAPSGRVAVVRDRTAAEPPPRAARAPQRVATGLV